MRQIIHKQLNNTMRPAKYLKQFAVISLFFFSLIPAVAQNEYNLDKNWICKNIDSINISGEQLSSSDLELQNWLPATVPGTVLTTLLNNDLVPDPFYGMNNKKIPDIYDTGRNCYTYWFVCDFNEKLSSKEEQVWLHLRGVNYSCEVYLNGKKLNKKTHEGMYLRQSYNITSFLSRKGDNRLAVLVLPPDPVGNPNGGQGGDGTIAKNVMHQYVAGWDWIQPIRDRNTGIWDIVTIEKNLLVNLKNPHVITKVPGKRFPGKNQEAAIITSSVEVENPTDEIIEGIIECTIDDKLADVNVTLQPHTTTKIELPDLLVENPKLWWPNGYGEQNLYDFNLKFIDTKRNLLDEENVAIGIREITTEWNERTRSAEIKVNGQKIFIKGGNWIISDAMLRLSPDRYDTEVRFHRDMNLNLIRIWGGALLERPEFYQACDKYGILVMQDFWFSGDCNGKWLDPKKKEDQYARRKYPDDHHLVIESAADQIKMVRNHASLAFWCGGNEITPPEDILTALQDSIIPVLDGTRFFFPYSNSDEMSYNFLGGNGDGPYGIQNMNTFWEHRTYPFNSEVGSVGTGDYESIKRFIPEENMVVPDYINRKIDSVWAYHKDLGYGHHINLYGEATDIKDFGEKAQLVNYNQYRALAEGFSAHMWDWYTGYMIWKTQNPWTSLRGQMYDYYLDPNACLYGLNHGAEPIHIMCNPVDGMIMAVNNTFETKRDLMLDAKFIKLDGSEIPVTKLILEVGASLLQKYLSVKNQIDEYSKEEGVFLYLSLSELTGETISENIYWYPDSTENYSGLQTMEQTEVSVDALMLGNNKIEVTITNPEKSPLAFFNRISLVDKNTGERVLPVFYDDNYVSILPGDSKLITIDYSKVNLDGDYQVSVRGWNVSEKLIDVVSK